MARRAAKSIEAEGTKPLGDQLVVLFDELLRSRDRLAGLPALTAQDVETVSRAMHEVIWFFLTPPKGRKTDLALSEGVKAELLKSAGNRSSDLYVMAIACVALKLAGSPRVPTPAGMLAGLVEYLDSLAFEYRLPKRTILAVLSRARKEVDARAAYIRANRPGKGRFGHPHELYRNRTNKSEKPDAFFRRVYGADVRRGLTQADLRRADPNFYNVLHAWCSRNGKRVSSIVPASRPRGH
jgi:hypothetical protein